MQVPSQREGANGHRFSLSTWHLRRESRGEDIRLVQQIQSDFVLVLELGREELGLIVVVFELGREELGLIITAGK